MANFMDKGNGRVSLVENNTKSYDDAFLFNKHNGNLISFKHSVGWDEGGIRIEMDMLDPGKNFEEAYIAFVDQEYDIRVAPTVYVAYGLGDRRSDWAGPILSKIVEISLNVNSRGARVIHMVLTHGANFFQMEATGVSPYNAPPNMTYVAEVFPELNGMKFTRNLCNEILNELVEKYIEKMVDAEGNTVVSLPPLETKHSAGENIVRESGAVGGFAGALTALAAWAGSGGKDRTAWETPYAVADGHLVDTDQKNALFGIFADFRKFGINVGWEGSEIESYGSKWTKTKYAIPGGGLRGLGVGVDRTDMMSPASDRFKGSGWITTKSTASPMSTEALREWQEERKDKLSQTQFRFTMQAPINPILKGGRVVYPFKNPLDKIEAQFTDNGPLALRIIDYPPTLKVLKKYNLILDPTKPAAIYGPENHIKRILQTPGKRPGMTFPDGVRKILDGNIEKRKQEILEQKKYIAWLEAKAVSLKSYASGEKEFSKGGLQMLQDEANNEGFRRTITDPKFLSPDARAKEEGILADLTKELSRKIIKWGTNPSEALKFEVDIDKKKAVYKSEAFKEDMSLANYGGKEEIEGRTYSSYWDGSNPNSDATMESILAGKSDVFKIDGKPVPVFRMNVKNPNVLDLSVARNNMYFWFLQKTKTSPIGQALLSQDRAAIPVKEIAINILNNDEAKVELAKKRDMYLYKRAGPNWRDNLIKESLPIVEKSLVSPEAKDKFQKLNTEAKVRVIEAIFLGMEPHGMANLTMHFDDKKRRHSFDLQKLLYGEMYNFAWSIDFTSLPMFHLFKPSDIGSTAVLLGRQPSILGGEGSSFLDELSINTNKRLRDRAQYYNAWFSGFYVMQGFEHTISDNKIESHFRCQKIMVDDTLDPEAKDAVDAVTERGPPMSQIGPQGIPSSFIAPGVGVGPGAGAGGASTSRLTKLMNTTGKPPKPPGNNWSYIHPHSGNPGRWVKSMSQAERRRQAFRDDRTPSQRRASSQAERNLAEYYKDRPNRQKNYKSGQDAIDKANQCRQTTGGWT